MEEQLETDSFIIPLTTVVTSTHRLTDRLTRCCPGLSLQTAPSHRGRPRHAGSHRLHAAGLPAVLSLQGPQEEREEQEAAAARSADGQRRRPGLQTGDAPWGRGGGVRAYVCVCLCELLLNSQMVDLLPTALALLRLCDTWKRDLFIYL